MFKVNNRSTRRCSGVFIVNIEYIRHIVLVFFVVVVVVVANFKHTNGRWNILVP